MLMLCIYIPAIVFADNNTCGLSATCCSPEAEEYFLQMLSEEYQSRLYHNLSMSVHHCLAEFNSSHSK